MKEYSHEICNVLLDFHHIMIFTINTDITIVIFIELYFYACIYEGSNAFLTRSFLHMYHQCPVR